MKMTDRLYDRFKYYQSWERRYSSDSHGRCPRSSFQFLFASRQLLVVSGMFRRMFEEVFLFP